MWKRRTADVVHTIFTDHKIQRLKPDIDFLAPLAETILTMDADRDLVFLEPQALSAAERDYFLGMAYLQLPPEQLAISDRQRAKGVESLHEFVTEAEHSDKRSLYSRYLSRAYATLATSYRAQGFRNLALDASERAVRYDSNFVVAYNYKCGLLTELGRPIEALECFQKSLALNPWDSLTYRHIGSLYARDGIMDEATKWFKLALSVGPDNIDANHYLGNALAEQQDLKGAIHFYETALALEPRDAEVYWDCALALSALGRPELAREYVKSGLKYAPTDSRGLDLLSKISPRANADQGIRK